MISETIWSLLPTAIAITAIIVAHIAQRKAVCAMERVFSSRASERAMRSASLAASQAGASLKKSTPEFSGSNKHFLTSDSPNFSYSSSNSMELGTANVEVTGAARLYRAASVWTAGLAVAPSNMRNSSSSSFRACGTWFLIASHPSFQAFSFCACV